MKKRILLIVLLLLVGLSAFSAASEYPNKKIAFVVGYAPGGGYDVFARAVAPYLSRHLPNNPAVLIVNKPGAGNRAAAEWMMKQKPDGYTIALWNGTLALGQIMSKVNYDFRKVSWLGRASTEVATLCVGKKGRYQSWEDFKKADDVRMGATGITTTISGVASILTFHGSLKKKLTIIPHDASSDSITAAIRGDIDGLINSHSTLAPSVESGDLVPIVQFSAEPYPDIPPSVPTILSLGHPELSALETNRLIGGPPGMDKKLVQIISDAFLKAQNDPEFVAMMKKTGRPNDPLPPQKVETLVNTLLDVMEKNKDVMSSFMKK